MAAGRRCDPHQSGVAGRRRARGFYLWGVLDRLLEDQGIEIAAISGTSAGALNGAALKAGMVAGGRAGAKASLAQLWGQVQTSGEDGLNPWLRLWLPYLRAANQIWQAALPYSQAGIAAQIYSPYASGAAWKNPLEAMVRRLDFSKVCAGDGPALFVSATNVRTGKIRVFSGQEITPEVLLASACLPTLFQSVEITDPASGVTDAFWDGGYTGNPALFPLYDRGLPDDIVVVSINPMRRELVPESPEDIQDRMNEISFNASLLGELRAVAFVKRLIAEGRIQQGQMKDVLIHLISDNPLMTELSASSKMQASPLLVKRLHDAGRAAAHAFLAAHRDDLNQRGTADLKGLFS